MRSADTLEPINIDPKTFLRDHCSLPPLPEVVSQIQETLQDENVAMGRVAELISSDPALLAQTLKIVNSAYYGLPWEITKARSAIAFLGLNEVYRMVLSLSVVNTLSIVGKKEELCTFWFHSIYTAICTKYLVKRYRLDVDTEELWSAAVLHDIGKLVYLKMFPEHYDALNHHSKQAGCLFSEAESHFSLPSSASMGVLLGTHWRLPERIREACEAHSLRDLQDDNRDVPLTDLQHCICLGNLLTTLAAEQVAESTRQQIAGVLMAELNCSEEELATLMTEIGDMRTHVQDMMGQFR